jgi:hypothetical protein
MGVAGVSVVWTVILLGICISSDSKNGGLIFMAVIQMIVALIWFFYSLRTIVGSKTKATVVSNGERARALPQGETSSNISDEHHEGFPALALSDVAISPPQPHSAEPSEL